MNGAFNEMANFNGMAALETPEFLLSKMDELGSPASYNHFSVGWAWAMNSPLQWTKQVASHWGGTRNGTIVHWPRGISEPGGIRSQFTHVIDLAPTILEAAGIPEPDHGERRPAVAHGRHLHALHLQRAGDARAARPAVLRDVRQPRPLLQGLECGHEAPARRGRWSARRCRPSTTTTGSSTTAPTTSARPTTSPPTIRTCWPSSSGSGSSRPPSTTCCPSTTAASSGPNPELAGRPTLIQGTTQLFFPGMGRLSENSVVSIKNKSFSVTAEVEVPEGGAEGVIIAQGGRFGGWARPRQGRPPEVRLQRARHP